MRTALFLLPLFLVAACSSLSEKSNSPLAGSTPTLLGETLPGLGDLDTESKADKEDSKWWGGYYGHKSTTTDIYGNKSSGD